MKRYIILCAASILLSGSIYAQKDTLNAVVQVENDYTPTVTKASKINATPQIELQNSNAPLDIVFSQKAHPFKQFTSERNVKEALPTQQQQKPGYARLGYGTNNNIDAKAIYSIAPTKRDHIELQGSFGGYSTRLDGISNKWDSRFYSTGIGAQYTHKFTPFSLGVEARMTNDVFNYQTYNSFERGTDKQNSASYGLLTKIISRSVGALSYKADIGYYMNTRKYSAARKERTTENHITAGGNIEYELPNEDIRRIGADLAINSFLYNGAMRPKAGGKYKDYTSVCLSPYLDFNINGIEIRLGVNTDILTANGAFFSIAPNCSIEGKLNDNISFFASATGGRTLNSFAVIEELSPYWLYTPGDRQYSATYNIADVSGGARFSLAPFSAGIAAGYSYTKDDLMHCLSAYDIIGTSFAQAISRNLYVCGNIGYDYGGWLKFSGEARYDHWSCTGEDYYLLYKPMITASLKTEARLYDGLYATIGYTFTGYTKAGSLRKEEMNLLNAKVNYKFHKQFAAYIQGNNLLGSKHHLYPGCEAQGANVLGGISVNF